MSSWICKLLRFLGDVASAIIRTFAEVVEVLVDGAGQVLGAIADVGSDLLSKPFTWVAIGLGLYLFLTTKDDENVKGT